MVQTRRDGSIVGPWVELKKTYFAASEQSQLVCSAQVLLRHVHGSVMLVSNVLWAVTERNLTGDMKPADNLLSLGKTRRGV